MLYQLKEIYWASTRNNVNVSVFLDYFKAKEALCSSTAFLILMFKFFG